MSIWTSLLGNKYETALRISGDTHALLEQDRHVRAVFMKAVDHFRKMGHEVTLISPNEERIDQDRKIVHRTSAALQRRQLPQARRLYFSPHHHTRTPYLRTPEYMAQRLSSIKAEADITFAPTQGDEKPAYPSIVVFNPGSPAFNAFIEAVAGSDPLKEQTNIVDLIESALGMEGAETTLPHPVFQDFKRLEIGGIDYPENSYMTIRLAVAATLFRLSPEDRKGFIDAGIRNAAQLEKDDKAGCKRKQSFNIISDLGEILECLPEPQRQACAYDALEGLKL